MNAENNNNDYEILNSDKIISFRKKKEKIVQIITKYKKSIIKITYYDSLHRLNERQEVEKSNCQAFVKYIDDILHTVSLTTKEYIENEFINNLDEQWCLKEHSRSYYYRIRNIAITEFFQYVQ